MDYNKLVLILMRWSLESKEYEIVYNLYMNWGIGIPVKYTYAFEEKNSFSSISSFLKENNIITSSDKYLKKILLSFRYSKYIRLEEWGKLYGYRFT